MVTLGLAKILVEPLINTFLNGGKLLLFGCGGSSTNASHIASEFVSHWSGVHLPALSLTTDVAVITCIANDYGFSDVFARQIEAHGKSGDFAIALSTKGDAMAVINGLERAHSKGLLTSAWTGILGGEFARMSDYPVIVEASEAGPVQQLHLEIGHLVSDMVCKNVNLLMRL